MFSDTEEVPRGHQTGGGEVMRRKPAYRYYCEFCGKSSGSGGHMSSHEKHCTANPNRKCRMCGRIGIEGLIETLGDGSEREVGELRKVANGCPACMLAAIRQSKLQCGWDEEGGGFSVPFRYSEEKARFWAERNEKEIKRDFAYYGFGG